MGLWKVYVWYFAEDIHLNTAASIFDKCICSTDPLNPEILIWSVSCLRQYSCASNWVSRIFRSSLQPALKLSQSQHPSFISYQAIPPKNIFREIIFLWQKIEFGGILYLLTFVLFLCTLHCRVCRLPVLPDIRVSCRLKSAAQTHGCIDKEICWQIWGGAKLKVSALKSL